MAEKRLRCAVYTRKSTEDGLDQEFNSLDAQYEACAAYALSQRHEGWTLVPDRYDDGGFSGGNMQRPGLKRLLADIAAGKVDIILVYKIDRLTRSLADFAKIVDVLDTAKASFVSITQSFNTTTSMGRLTLNMLLSFAQFEREVTGERIRDKIAASKRKGLWMGGPVPMGYAVDDRKLVAHLGEAELVRHIMQRYLELSSVVQLAEELNAQGYRTKVQRRTSGPHRGGCIFRRGTLFHMLSNRIYIGELSHKGAWFDGEHEAIVPTSLWEAVQEKLKANASGSSRRIRAIQPSLLIGLLFDGEGRAMTSSHATKPGKRYRYYVTRPDLIDGTPAWRVGAHDLEKLILGQLSTHLMDRHAVMALAGEVSADVLDRALKTAALKASAITSGSNADKLPILAAIDRIMMREDRIELLIHQNRFAALLGLDQSSEREALELILPVLKVRRGHQLRLIIPGPEMLRPTKANRDEKLVTLLAEAHWARQLILGSPDRSIAAIASEQGRCRTRLGKLVALSCLAPNIVTAVLEGRQPANFTVRSLTSTDLPLDWADQRRALGFT
ncbi:recombinase family protein [Sphingobium sp. B12D2B]|uniref:recombinase family protein n=1 Tax=Sphingobium sp. B12D2B TaxID=2940577 RepID=UPI0022249D6C|nr:recombinase family protein [Sphingobium sp. B12D2B]MCW2349118.1 DNA invertase Pin-like site-specific DNA recombinase [Sphingobium sp. B12D2B]